MQDPTPPPEPTDEELDTYIHTRYRLLGIDVSVLPVADEDAPMDQERLLANARSILRQDVRGRQLPYRSAVLRCHSPFRPRLRPGPMRINCYE